jgi:hypothetical protein
VALEFLFEFFQLGFDVVESAFSVVRREALSSPDLVVRVFFLEDSVIFDQVYVVQGVHWVGFLA